MTYPGRWPYRHNATAALFAAHWILTTLLKCPFVSKHKMILSRQFPYIELFICKESNYFVKSLLIKLQYEFIVKTFSLNKMI